MNIHSDIKTINISKQICGAAFKTDDGTSATPGPLVCD